MSLRMRPVLWLSLLAATLVLAAMVLLAARAAGSAFADGRGGVPVLVYHDFWDGPSDDRRRFTSASEFAAQMEYLHAHGYHVVPLRSLIRYMESGEPLPEKPVVITFDDGYLGNYTVAFPILKKYNMPATIFLIAGFDQVPQAEDGHKRLTWEQMREMQDSGLIDIQSHTFDLHYKVYTDQKKKRLLPATVARAYRFDLGRRETPEEFEEKLYNDLLKGRLTIEGKLGKKVDTLAWPFGAYTQRSLEVARRAGYRYFATTLVGLNGPGGSVEAIRRVSVRAGASAAELEHLLNPQNFYLKNLLRLLTCYLDYLKDNYLGA